MGSRIRDTVRFLFELYCEVSPSEGLKEPYIVKKYPESYKNEEELRNIPKFAFPCQLENSFAQHYSFVLTSVDSKYTFCFCRFDPKSNCTLVLLSHLPWHDIFYKLLNCIANLIHSPEAGELYSFLEACRIRPPMPGHTLKVTYNAGASVFSCQCPDVKLPSIPENLLRRNLKKLKSQKKLTTLIHKHERNPFKSPGSQILEDVCEDSQSESVQTKLVFGRLLKMFTVKNKEGKTVVYRVYMAPKFIPCNLTEYFSAMDSACMAGLWAALLHERRVAIVASKLSRLSACVQAANATLFPMSWQHIFIPILPKHLVDYLLAPMPFLIGVPRTVMENVRLSEIGDVVILDVDENELRTPFRDLESLPSDLVASLKKALSDKNALGDAVSRAFLRSLVCLIGGYRDAIKIENGQLITFNPEAFVKTRKNMQPFLKKILQSQIFQQFIDERLDLLNSGRGFNDEFEVECNNYADKISSGSGQKLKQQYRDWAKTVKKEGGAFFKNVKDKANPAVQSAVKSVRQGGKNMKSVVRGLKNKMPRTGSRPSSINTTDDSRYSCGSATPVSSDSSSSSPSHGACAVTSDPLKLDLLNEMQFLFSGEHENTDRNNDKAKTMPCAPPRIADRPQLPGRYPIVSTRRLVDVSDAPAPPPRHAALTPRRACNVASMTRDVAPPPPARFHTSALSFGEGSDKATLTLSVSSMTRRIPPPAAPCNGGRTAPLPPIRTRPHESSGSDFDLIKLDDTPNELAEFDPLKCRDRGQKEPIKTSTDSALLHEYGLDFSRFGLLDMPPSCSAQPDRDANTNVHKNWTTFN